MGLLNEASDNASGPDTECDDVCTPIFGIGCDQFEEGYIKASNTDAEDSFGHSVALSGDTLAVGTYEEGSNATGIGGDQSDNSAQQSGEVYIFTRLGGVWSQQAYLKASNAAADDQFGRSLALSGDTLAVGSAGESSGATGIGGDQSDNSAQQSGAVYVFTRTNDVWSQTTYVKASNTDQADGFGRAVALSGDTLAVSAIGESSNATGVDGDQSDNSAHQSGAAYVFTRTNEVWSQQAYIKASNTERDNFGAAIALSGDTIAVGAPAEFSAATGINGDESDNSAPNTGAVYVFVRTGSVWSQQAYVKASNAGQDDEFGGALTLVDDTLVVGSLFEGSSAIGVDGDQSDNSAHQSGAAYVFTRTNEVWSQQAYIKASNTEEGAAFGVFVALSGDTLAVTGGLGNANGGIYLFTRGNGVWSQWAYLKAPTEDSDGFGGAIAISSETLAVAALGEDSNATWIDGDQADNSALQSGAVYVRRLGLM